MRGTPEIMFCRILLFLWSLGALNLQKLPYCRDPGKVLDFRQVEEGSYQWGSFT